MPAYTGVTVTTETTFDWSAVGLHLATLGSDEQAALLDGLAAGLYGLGTVAAAHQIHYIADAVRGRSGWFVGELADSLTTVRSAR